MAQIKSLSTTSNKIYWQLGLRAALCVMIVWGIDAYLHLPRPYWGILTVLLIVKQSWGETISFASKRFAMTLIGCGVGTLLYLFVFNGDHLAMLICMLISIFMIVFWIPKYYASAMFAVGILVVMLFGLISTWNVGILTMRIEQTALACIVVVVVMRLLMPRFARHDLRANYRTTLETMQNLWQQLICKKSQSTTQMNQQILDSLGQTLADLRQSYTQMQYELLAHPRTRKHVQRMMRHLMLSGHYLTSLVQAWPTKKKLNADTANLLAMIQQNITIRLEQTIQMLNTDPSELSELTLPTQPKLSILLSPKLNCIFENIDMTSCQTQANLDLAAIAYYSVHLDEELTQLINRYYKWNS